MQDTIAIALKRAAIGMLGLGVFARPSESTLHIAYGASNRTASRPAAVCKSRYQERVIRRTALFCFTFSRPVETRQVALLRSRPEVVPL